MIWLSISIGLLIGAFIYCGILFILALIRKRKAKKNENSIEE